MRLLGWRGSQGEGAVPKVGEQHRHPVLSVKAMLQGSLDSRGQKGQARDNLIWGGVGGHREKAPGTSLHISNRNYRLRLLTNFQALLGQALG